MENTTSIGMNRTGLEMAPMSKDDMVEFAIAKAPEAPLEEGEFEALHMEYIEEADGLGSVPIPGNLKGMASTGMEKLKGNKPEVLIDKLGERLAFERGGTRLYEALILKCSAIASQASTNGGSTASGIDVDKQDGAVVDLSMLERIRSEEENHFQLVRRALTTLGADPTAMTPCADVVGVSTMGLIQTVTDPSTTVPQCLNAVLTAELTDNAGWELLIELVADAGHTEMAKEFSVALEEERIHLETIKNWLRTAVLAEAS
ncbi:MAG TPA: ferritin-like domain-containing protein [Burkholderiales bacterium]|nr:ferritin-like domain-containing protein [Burkholderiales bacterium]